MQNYFSAVGLFYMPFIFVKCKINRKHLIGNTDDAQEALSVCIIESNAKYYYYNKGA